MFCEPTRRNLRVILDLVGVLLHPYGRERSTVATRNGSKMYSMTEVFMWAMLGVVSGFTGGHVIGFKEGKREGFVRGKIAASNKAGSR